MIYKTINIIVCLGAILTLSACDFCNEKQPVQKSEDNTATVEGISKEIKDKIAAQDTLMNALVLKVDTIAQALSQVQKDNLELKAQLSKLKSPKSTWLYITIGAFVLGLISLIISLCKPNNSHRLQKLQENVNKLLSSSSNNRNSQTSTPSCATNCGKRLCQLEVKVNQLFEIIGKTPIPMVQPPSIGKTPIPTVQPPSEYQKIGYAKVDTDEYFTTIFDSNQEGCVFKITFTTQTKGYFNIIALDKIQSRNDWQKKVECSGVSIKEASDFRLGEEGLCEKIDENTWKVTKPLKITLIK